MYPLAQHRKSQLIQPESAVKAAKQVRQPRNPQGGGTGIQCSQPRKPEGQAECGVHGKQTKDGMEKEKGAEVRGHDGKGTMGRVCQVQSKRKVCSEEGYKAVC